RAFHTPLNPLFPAQTPGFLAFSPPTTSPIPGTKRLPGRASGPAYLPNRHPTAMARSLDLSRLFRQPESPAHPRFEACRAYFLDSTPAADIARRFQLQVDTVRAIVRDFARDPDVKSF